MTLKVLIFENVVFQEVEFFYTDKIFRMLYI